MVNDALYWKERALKAEAKAEQAFEVLSFLRSNAKGAIREIDTLKGRNFSSGFS